MLAAELAAHKNKSKASDAPACQHAEVGPTSAPPTAESTGVAAEPLPILPSHQVSQSLPSGNQMSLLARNLPRKPRVRPSPAPSLTALPILELPEPSLSDSYGDTTGLLLEDQGATAGPDEADESGGTSLFEPPQPRQVSFQYAASAPASMLWGAHAHKHGTSAMGGRTPSKTMLDVLQLR